MKSGGTTCQLKLAQLLTCPASLLATALSGTGTPVCAVCPGCPIDTLRGCMQSCTGSGTGPGDVRPMSNNVLSEVRRGAQLKSVQEALRQNGQGPNVATKST